MEYTHILTITLFPMRPFSWPDLGPTHMGTPQQPGWTRKSRDGTRHLQRLELHRHLFLRSHLQTLGLSTPRRIIAGQLYRYGSVISVSYCSFRQVLVWICRGHWWHLGFSTPRWIIAGQPYGYRYRYGSVISVSYCCFRQVLVWICRGHWWSLKNENKTKQKR